MHFSYEKKISVIDHNDKFERKYISGSSSVFNYVKQFYNDDIELYESFFAVYLNQSNNTIGWLKVSQGGIAGTVVDPIIITKGALDTLAKGVILCHNHPSGALSPSDADKNITEKMKQCLKIFDIRLIDHIIISKTGYFSFADDCLI